MLTRWGGGPLIQNTGARKGPPRLTMGEATTRRDMDRPVGDGPQGSALCVALRIGTTVCPPFRCTALLRRRDTALKDRQTDNIHEKCKTILQCPSSSSSAFRWTGGGGMPHGGLHPTQRPHRAAEAAQYPACAVGRPDRRVPSPRFSCSKTQRGAKQTPGGVGFGATTGRGLGRVPLPLG